MSFKIQRYDGSTVRDYKVEQTKKLHLYVVRTDLAVFRHLHPTMSQDGTWSAALTLPTPGEYRVVAQFVARDEGGSGDHLMLGSTKTVPGRWTHEPLPRTRDGDDGTIEVAARGTVAVGNDGRLDLEVRNSWGGADDPGQLTRQLRARHRLPGAHRRGRCTCNPWDSPRSAVRGPDSGSTPSSSWPATTDSSCRCGWTAPAHGPGHGHRPPGARGS